MMKPNNLLMTFALLFSAALFTACDDDDSPDARTSAVATLTSKAWSHAKVSHSDGDLSADYAGLVIQFTSAANDNFDGTFTIVGGGYAFAESSGKWKFNDSFDEIMLSSGKTMKTILSKDKLRLEFSVAPKSGRVSGVSGQFVFELSPL